MNLAIITARGGSKRIPRKNIRDFCGKPIIAYSIQAARDSRCFDEVMVSTDDTEIAEVARRYGAEIPFLRSAETSNDFATTADVLLEVLARYDGLGKKPENFCCIYPTAPLVTKELLQEGLRLLEKDKKIDGAFPVLRFSFPIQRALRMESGLVSFMEPANRSTRSQDLEPAYHDAGQFYWARVSRFEKTRSLVGNATAGIVIPPWQAQDIDHEEDWKLAELKYRFIEQAP